MNEECMDICDLFLKPLLKQKDNILFTLQAKYRVKDQEKITCKESHGY